MSLIPITSAVSLVPAALVAGRVATQAIGDFAGLLQDALETSTPQKDATKIADAPTSGTNRLAGLLTTFRSAFQNLLNANGLDSAPGLELRLDASGDVDVEGNHPQRETIQGLLNASPQLTELFRQIAAHVTEERRAEELAAFQRNPDRPQKEFPVLFSKDANNAFRLLVQGSSVTPTFG